MDKNSTSDEAAEDIYHLLKDYNIPVLEFSKSFHKYTEGKYIPDVRTFLSLEELREYQDELKTKYGDLYCPECNSTGNVDQIELVYVNREKGHGQRTQFNCKECSDIVPMGTFLRYQESKR